MPTVRQRPSADPSALPAGLHPVLRRVYAARGITTAEELNQELARLQAPVTLRGIDAACELLADAIRNQRRIVVAGDYDADGATATAVAVLGLKALGAADVDYVVPNRFTMGYGLSPALTALAIERGAELIVTVDNGIVSHAGIAAANAAGVPVLVTDHHLAGNELPPAAAVVNPNQPGCGFPSRHLAGVGVMFYVLLALRARLRSAGAFNGAREPNLADLLDLVALGTVADLVRLDRNNRVLVAQGIARIRSGRARPGILALLTAAGRMPDTVRSADLGFVLGPRLNAAGRLDDMRTGIECLLTDSVEVARTLAQSLDQLNRERRGIEAQMRDEAIELVSTQRDSVGVTLFDEQWHEGVVGLVASRVKDRVHRPVIAFACAAEEGMLKGSGRSISGLHLRDALAAVDARAPGLIVRYGGHAMAAGLSLQRARLDEFGQRFDAVCRELLDEEALEQVIESDGELAPAELALETAQAIEEGGPWGQGFPEPMFEGLFDVREMRLIGATGLHVRYRLDLGGRLIDAVDFGGAERAVNKGRVRLLYKLAVSRFRGTESLEIRVEQLWPVQS